MSSGAKVIDIDRGWKRIVRSYGRVDKDAHVKVGVLSEAGSYDSKGEANLADVATWMEFGVPAGPKNAEIPARPFMAKTFDKNTEQLKNRVEIEQRAIIMGKRTPQVALQLIGLFWQAEIQKQMRISSDYEELADSTVARRRNKSNKPLIDSGQLIDSISFQVIDGPIGSGE